MKNFLIDAGLWQCIEPEQGQLPDPDLDRRALAKINLSIKHVVSAETKKAETAKQAWEALRNAYEDKGVVRRIGLYASLFKTKYSEFSSMTEYISHIISIAEQLDCIGKPLDDETVGGIILGGLPESYRPLILGIQGSNQCITTEFVKNLLLQDNVKSLIGTAHRSTDNAFLGKIDKHQPSKIHFKKNKKPRCFNCNDLGHYSSYCTKPPKKPTKTANLSSQASNRLNNYFVNQSSFSKPDDWYLDSGCNAHMTPRIDLMVDIHDQHNGTISVANGHQLEAHESGTVNISLPQGSTAVLNNVIHVPDLSANLLSVSQMAMNDKTLIFDSNGCRVTSGLVSIPGNKVIATATLDRGLYKLDKSSPLIAATAILPHDVWHRRLGHLNRYDMQLLTKMSTNFYLEPDPKTPCTVCVEGKQHRTPFPAKSMNRATRTLGLVHSDLCGPMQTPSVGGARYFLTFTDDFSRKSFVYFLASKDQVTETFIEFKALVENQTGNHICILRTDNGGEYVNRKLCEVLKKAGIKHQLTIPRTPEQNGVAERLNRTLVEKARSMLIDAQLPKSLWAEAIFTANYLKNRSPTKSVKHTTPEEAWTGSRPDLSHLRIFGCKAMSHVPQPLRSKWDPKSEAKIFVGYSEHSKGYRLADPKTLKVIVSRDVVFLENELGIKKTPEQNHALLPEAETITTVIEDHSYPEETSSTDGTLTGDSSPTPETHSDVLPDKRVPIPNCRIFNDDYVVYQANLCQGQDPNTYDEAMATPAATEWKTAMDEEINAHLKNQTWEYCNLPPGKQAIKSRWIFKTKLDSEGNIERYKARLVAKGYSQTQGIDYDETFSPTVRHSSIRLLLSIAANLDLSIDQMDVVTAFLHPKLMEEIYMEFPNTGNQFKQKYCKLKKTIYGLKQSNRMWHQEIDKTLRNLGLARSTSDPCIYHKHQGNNIMIVAIYVDDLLILYNNIRERDTLKNALSRRFNMKDLGKVHHILGMRVRHCPDQGTIKIDQSTYIRNMLARFNMTDCKPASTPLTPGHKLSKTMISDSSDTDDMTTIPYREAVGSLIYAALGTRPDICHAVSVVSRFSNNPSKEHWAAVKRIFRYLKGTIDRSIVYSMSGGNLCAFSDSDWASDTDDRRSTTGYIIRNSGGAISWNSRKQPTVALSTTEAEYMALSSATQEVIWIRQLYAEMTNRPSLPVTPLYCDNKGAIFLSSNLTISPRSRHIDIRHHFLREKVLDGSIDVQYIDTTNNASDALTKGLPPELFNKCIGQFGLE